MKQDFWIVAKHRIAKLLTRKQAKKILCLWHIALGHPFLLDVYTPWFSCGKSINKMYARLSNVWEQIRWTIFLVQWCCSCKGNLGRCKAKPNRCTFLFQNAQCTGAQRELFFLSEFEASADQSKIWGWGHGFTTSIFSIWPCFALFSIGDSHCVILLQMLHKRYFLNQCNYPKDFLILCTGTSHSILLHILRRSKDSDAFLK